MHWEGFIELAKAVVNVTVAVVLRLRGLA